MLPAHAAITPTGVTPVHAGKDTGRGARASRVDGFDDASAGCESVQDHSISERPGLTNVARGFLCAPSLVGRSFQCVDPDSMFIGDTFDVHAVCGWYPGDIVIGRLFADGCRLVEGELFDLTREWLSTGWVEVTP